MAYQRSWDESSPPGTLPADQIDTAIQNDKIATRERLEQVIPGFGDDNVDPKRVRSLLIGTLAQRPSVNFGGAIFYATDENKLFYSDSGGNWQDWPSSGSGVTLLRGTAVERPNPATADFYYATDTGQFFVKNAADPPAYVQITGGGSVTPIDWKGRSYAYIAQNAAGSRVVSPRNATGLAAFNVLWGETNLNADGVLIIPWSEFAVPTVNIARENVDLIMAVPRSRSHKNVVTGDFVLEDAVHYEVTTLDEGICILAFNMDGTLRTTGLLSCTLLIITAGEAPDIEIMYPLDFRAVQDSSACPDVVHRLSWDNAGVEDLKTIERSVDGGSTWTTLASNIGPGVTEYVAMGAPSNVTSKYRIKFNGKNVWADAEGGWGWCAGPITNFQAVQNTGTCPVRTVELSWDNGDSEDQKIIEVSTNYGMSWTVVAENIPETEDSYTHENAPESLVAPLMYRISEQGLPHQWTTAFTPGPVSCA